jgi:O-acetylhomoserine (thiol)-lyase
MTSHTPTFSVARELSPRRNTTTAADIPSLVEEQLRHFSIDPATEFGQRLGALASSLYTSNVAAHELWHVTLRELAGLEQRDRVARFNAKRFLCFQLAKILDTLTNPLRKSYQSLLNDPAQSATKGPYPIFDNVTALFSATPVITRTATYMYACAEWVEDAFKGREPLLEIYSRLLNPTSISLANHIVRRHLPVAPRLVRQGVEPQRGRGMVRRLHHRGIPHGARADAHAARGAHRERPPHLRVPRVAV